MTAKPHPRHEAFLAELKKTKRLFGQWQGIAFRAAPLEFARIEKLLDGMGSFRFGGRWSAAGAFRAVNLSLTQDTALKESGANFAHYNLADDLNPKVLIGVRLKLERVIDLTKPRGVAQAGWLDPRELLEEDWRKQNDLGCESLTQAFGRAAFDAGAKALLAPSARVPGGVNLVYFPESIRGRSSIDILGQGELARWLKKR